jgi:hypothetical protein
MLNWITVRSSFKAIDEDLLFTNGSLRPFFLLHYTLAITFFTSHIDIFNFDLYFWAEQGYSVVLPEKLRTGKWNVYRYTSSNVPYINCYTYFSGQVLYYLFHFGRSARSPLKLMSRFPDHPDIGTLHDSFVWALLLLLFKTSFKIHKVNV